MLSDEQKADIQRMRDQGMRWKPIARVLGITQHLIRREVDPGYRTKVSESAAKQNEVRKKPARPSSYEPGPALRAADVDAMRRRLPPDTRSTTQVLLGDPRPGRELMEVRHG